MKPASIVLLQAFGAPELEAKPPGLEVRRRADIPVPRVVQLVPRSTAADQVVRDMAGRYPVVWWAHGAWQRVGVQLELPGVAR